MSMNRTPSGNRIHITVVGRRNSGKSSLVNAITGQNTSLVSPIAGTTTDPVSRAMELHGAGPVVLIDTPGIDDDGELGLARVSRTLKTLSKTDIAVLVIDPFAGFGEPEQRLVSEFTRRGIPFVGVLSKTDLTDLAAAGAGLGDRVGPLGDNIRDMVRGSGASFPIFAVSARSGAGMHEFLAALAEEVKKLAGRDEPAIVGDLIAPGDVVLLVVPVDLEAPKGRLILPQVQTVRDILDHDGAAVMVKESQITTAMSVMSVAPRLVVTDSRVFREVAAAIPPEVPLTSFSILFARHKGDIGSFRQGAESLDKLSPGDSVLISEACTHHPVEDDIGKVKIPTLLRRRVGGDLDFAWCRGADFPEDLARFKVVIHCGGCMLNRKEVLSRIEAAAAKGVPVTNYGMTIAWAQGILTRALKPFDEISIDRPPPRC